MRRLWMWFLRQVSKIEYIPGRCPTCAGENWGVDPDSPWDGAANRFLCYDCGRKWRESGL